MIADNEMQGVAVHCRSLPSLPRFWNGDDDIQKEPASLSLRQKPAGITLIELLVAMAILALLMVILAQVTGSSMDIWRKSSSQSQKFRQARVAMETIRRTLSQATLNTYYDYLDDQGKPRTTSNASTFVPTHYGPVSELRFLSGPAVLNGTAADGGKPVTHAIFFQAPTGDVNTSYLRPLESLLNTYGYFIELNSDKNTKPSFAGSERIRFRLMQMAEPSENLALYGVTSGSATNVSKAWYTTPLASVNNTTCLAENVLCLIFRAHDEKTLSSYDYDSLNPPASVPPIPLNQLPPIVDVTLVTLDETSAARLAASAQDQIAALGITGLFTKPEEYANDIAKLEQTLITGHYGYRVFKSSVSIEGAKWSVH